MTLRDDPRFDEDYFERGVAKGVSLYERYRWIPERSLREAHWFLMHLGACATDRVLDFGCAKGFFVYALRLLGYRAWGFDVSAYAREHAEPAVAEYITGDVYDHTRCELGFCKDVLEHSRSVTELDNTLTVIRSMARTWLFVIPLARDGHYVHPEYEKDVTHVQRMDAPEWLRKIWEAGFVVINWSNQLKGIKENWTSRGLPGDLFVIARRVG